MTHPDAPALEARIRRLERASLAQRGRPLPGGRPVTRALVVLVASLPLAAACAGEGDPAPDAPAAVEGLAPDSFAVVFETSEGPVEMTFLREWSPLAVDRVYELASDNHWAGARLYRVNPRYAQFGYTGRPAVDSLWIGASLPDEPVVGSNVRGTVSFARGGPDTRSVILFVNRGDNTNLDDLDWNGVLGFPPVGRVTSGMDAVDRFHDAYSDDVMMWEDSIAGVGNSFLDREFPGLDSIESVRVVDVGN